MKSLDNTLLDDAVGKLFADADGKMKPYKKADLDYDISCGWLVVEVDGKDVGVLFCFVLFCLQLSVCLWWLRVPLRILSDA